MKKMFFLLILILSIININAQSQLVYKCVDDSQKDSISIDLKSKGFFASTCSFYGEYLHLKSSDNFCFESSPKGYKEVSLKEIYSFVKKTDPRTFEDYLTETDPFNGEKTYRGGIPPISFTKIKSKTSTEQYIHLSVNGSTLNYGCEGVYILFENGEKIERSKEKVDTDYSSGSWSYSAFFTPTANEIKLLKTQKVIAVKLYIYKQLYIPELDQNTILEDAKIILTTLKPKLKKNR